VGSIGITTNNGIYKIWNNTFQSNPNQSILRCGAATNTIADTNNHYVDDAGSYTNGTCSGLTSLHPLLMSNLIATNDGYTSGNSYAPTSNGSPTVGAGTNERNGYCAAMSASADALVKAAGAACQSDTTDACTYAVSSHTISCPSRTTTARPATAAWDVGAYQFAGGNPPVNPVTVRAAGVF